MGGVTMVFAPLSSICRTLVTCQETSEKHDGIHSFYFPVAYNRRMLASVPPMIIRCVLAGTSQALNSARYCAITCSIPSRPLSDPKTMLAVLPEPAWTVVLTAAFSELSKGELRGLRWGDFNGKELTVNRIVWNGVTNDPKAKNRGAAV